MSGLWRRHPDKKGKFQAIDLGHAEWNSSGEMESDIWLNRRGSRKDSSSSQKYADGWDRIFGKEKGK
jgi:hypothetical protein